MVQGVPTGDRALCKEGGEMNPLRDRLGRLVLEEDEIYQRVCQVKFWQANLMNKRRNKNV
jgi:hypothetical protein